MQVTVSLERFDTYKKDGCAGSRLLHLKYMAERVGFEPTVRCRITGFQDRLLKPLGHLSVSAWLLYQKLQGTVKEARINSAAPS